MRMTISGIPDGTRYEELTGGITYAFGDVQITAGDALSDVLTGGSDVKLVVNADSESERPPLRLWSVTTSVTLLRTIDGEQWETVRRVAPLYFDADLQGIQLASDAESLARRIIGQGVVEHPDVTVVIEASAMLITYKLAAEQ